MQAKCFVLVILPFTYRVVNISWKAGSLQSLLDLNAMVKQTPTGKTGVLGRAGDSSVSAVFVSPSEASPSRRLEVL